MPRLMKPPGAHQAQAFSGRFVVSQPGPTTDFGKPPVTPNFRAAKRGQLIFDPGGLVLRRTRTWQKFLIVLGMSPGWLLGAAFVALLATVIFPALEKMITPLFLIACVPAVMGSWKVAGALLRPLDRRISGSRILAARIVPPVRYASGGKTQNLAIEIVVAPAGTVIRPSISLISQWFPQTQCMTISFFTSVPADVFPVVKLLSQYLPPVSPTCIEEPAVPQRKSLALGKVSLDRFIWN